MFPSSAIIKEYGISKDKGSYYLLYGIALVFREETFLTCEKSLLHSMLSTEIFCQIFHIYQMGVLLRSWDSVEYQQKLIIIIIVMSHQNS